MAPFLDATEAGLWVFWVLEREVLAVPRPGIRTDEAERLHCEDGPAVCWPQGAQYWFWRGVQVSERLITRPRSYTPAEIQSERNIELRRAMMERYGQEAFLLESGALEMHRDDFGVLYRLPFADDEPLVMVKVVNATPEPDGTYKDYFLRVPPNMSRARQAVAWTFNLSEQEYSAGLRRAVATTGRAES